MTLEAPSTASSAPKAEPILNTLLLIARRADVLARHQRRTGRETDRRVWLRAEWEIFESFSERAEPSGEAA